MKRQIITNLTVGFAMLSVMLCSIPFSKTSAVAWWSMIYPSSLYEAGVLEKQETAEKAADSEVQYSQDNMKKEETAKAEESDLQIKWKLVEWISGYF